MTYFERGCAIHGEVSRREGRNCIERVGKHISIVNSIAVDLTCFRVKQSK